MTGKDSPALAGLQRFMLGWTHLKLAVWALFLLVAPAIWLQRGMVGAAILTGLLGLMLDVWAIDLLLGWTRGWAPTIRRLLMLYHLGIAVAGGWLLMQPIDPRWTLLPATADINNVAVAGAPEGMLVLGGGRLWLYPRDGEPAPLDYPGPFAWVAHTTADGAVWVVPRDEPQAFRRLGDTWDAIPRPPGNVRALAGTRRLWLAAGTGLFSLRPEDGRPGRRGRWDRFDECPHVTGVAVAPDDEAQVLVVGKVWCISPDAGGEWIDVTPTDEVGTFPEAAIGGGGWQYVFGGGHLSSTLHVRGPGEPRFTTRTAPASDVRVLVADPRDGRRAWIGTWGEGVFATADGGATWTDFGLQKIQIRSMALDPIADRLSVASSNTIFDKGIYRRSIAQ